MSAPTAEQPTEGAAGQPGEGTTGQPGEGTTGQPGEGIAVPAAVGLLVATVVAVLATVGLVVSLTVDRLPTGPALAPPPPPVPAVSYDSLLRRARLADVVVHLPAKPYECPDSPSAAPPILASGLICEAPVHARYNGTDNWSATVGFGSVPDDLIRPTAAGTAKAVFEQLRSAAFADHETTLRNQGIEEIDLHGHPVSVIRGQVHYQVSGVPSGYDRMVVVALPLEDGGYALYFASRPNDTPQATLDRLDASLGSLRYER